MAAGGRWGWGWVGREGRWRAWRRARVGLQRLFEGLKRTWLWCCVPQPRTGLHPAHPADTQQSASARHRPAGPAGSPNGREDDRGEGVVYHQLQALPSSSGEEVKGARMRHAGGATRGVEAWLLQALPGGLPRWLCACSAPKARGRRQPPPPTLACASSARRGMSAATRVGLDRLSV